MTATLPHEADAWASAWHERLTASGDFADAADGFDAAVLFVIEPDESYDGDPVGIRVDVENGECTGATEIDETTDEDYALRGPYEAWKAMLRDELDVAAAVMGGPFEVEGNTMALMQYRDAFAEMVRAARDVDTEFAY